MPHGFPRQNIGALYAATREKLNTRILAYIESDADPVGVHENHFGNAHGGVRFALWHRRFLREFETWQRRWAVENDREFLPLAYWYPSDPIPSELPHPGRNANIPPVVIPQAFLSFQGLQQQTDVEDFVAALEDFHDAIHGTIGGVMTGGRSPEDPIFWPLHAAFDHIVANWESLHGDIVDGAAIV